MLRFRFAVWRPLRGTAPRAFGGEWAEGAMAMESEIAMSGQTRGKEFDGRVLAKAKGLENTVGGAEREKR